MRVYPIVEGHGEVEAAPVLLRRLLAEAPCQHIGVGRPIRRTRSQLRSKEGIQAGVRLALLQPEGAAVVILFDGEDDCPKELAAPLRAWAHEAAAGKPCDVVVAYREYETWFFAAIESLRGECGIARDAAAPVNPESKRDAKGALEEFMPAEAPAHGHAAPARIYQAALRQGHYLLGTVHPWNEDAALCLLTESRSAEHWIRPNAGAIEGFAFLHRFGPYDQKVTDVSRTELLRETIVPMMCYLVTTHVTGTRPTRDGKPWGDAWQSAHWTQMLGRGAWFVWAGAHSGVLG